VGRPGYSVLLFTLQVTALSVGITWLYAHTRGSLWLTMLIHAAINNTGGIVQSASAPARDPWTLSAPPMVWIYAAVLWIPAIWFLVRMPKREGGTGSSA
jgi:membrane protease YdiL (CAAX protease family)